MGQIVQSEVLADLVKHLPLKLRLGVCVEVLEMAITENVIGITADGKLEWKLQSKTLQAYFCGRMWCGDMCVYNEKMNMRVWKFGKQDFPSKDLEELFQISGLRNLRRQRNYLEPPKGFQLIDNLFV